MKTYAMQKNANAEKKKGNSMKICPNCGAECPDNVSFCTNCGNNVSNVKPPEQKNADSPSFCPKCGGSAPVVLEEER